MNEELSWLGAALPQHACRLHHPKGVTSPVSTGVLTIPGAAADMAPFSLPVTAPTGAVGADIRFICPPTAAESPWDESILLDLVEFRRV